ncbi:hypothetical protein GCM10009846_23940 [Agrococcus versicolor]|uniref:Uncharacterized protein n=1 Tax=Agrococcus versicolor TaxID=501482 RepID=A0ABN3AVI0_9MICO
MTLDSQLRSLDAAAGQPDARRRARGASLADGIVHAGDHRSRSRRATMAWRVGGIVAAGSLVAAGAILLPGLGRTLPAVASWTAEAGPVSDGDLAIAEDACRQHLASEDAIDADTPVVLAERRGDLVGLILYEASPESQGSCIVELPAGASSASGVLSAFGGQSGDALVPPPGELMEGALAQFRAADGEVSLTSGAVGEGVVGVELHAGGITTEATVADGRFVAWWPGAAFEDADLPSGQDGPRVVITYDLTLSDGTVVTDADSWFPGR